LTNSFSEVLSIWLEWETEWAMMRGLAQNGKNRLHVGHLRPQNTTAFAYYKGLTGSIVAEDCRWKCHTLPLVNFAVFQDMIFSWNLIPGAEKDGSQSLYSFGGHEISGNLMRFQQVDNMLSPAARRT